MLIKKERFHFAQEEEGQLMVDVTDRVNNRPIDGASVSICPSPLMVYSFDQISDIKKPFFSSICLL